MKQQYTVGFLFNKDKTKVALIRKTKPTWQVGRLNGIGGKIEKGETPTECMNREFYEEVEYPKMREWEWIQFATLDSDLDEFMVSCFAASGDLLDIKEKTEEKVEIIDVASITPLRRTDMIENLPWLIAMAIDCLDDGRPEFSLVLYPKT